MVITSLCEVVRLLAAGVTVTVGVVGFWFVVPPPPWLPLPHPATENTTPKRRNTKIRLANRFIKKPPLSLLVNGA
jgi:hypothetical protein